MPSEFHNREPPLPFGNPKSRPWYGMDIFWNRPLEAFTCNDETSDKKVTNCSPYFTALQYINNLETKRS